MVADADPLPPPAPATRNGLAEGLIVLLLGLLAIGLAAWWIASPSDPRETALRSFAKNASSAAGGSGRFAGDAACAQCHSEAAEAHAKSGHSRTLRLASETDAARTLDGKRTADPDHPGVEWSYSLKDGRFSVTRTQGPEVETTLIDFAFGSGTHATTFVSITDPDPAHPACLEHRLTWYEGTKSLDVTPGHETQAPASGVTPRGRPLASSKALRCFACHTTATSSVGPDILDFATASPNVRCERCHGPAREHVARARAGELDLTMPMGAGRLKADAILRACGECHRHPDNTPKDHIRPDNLEIVRHQPVGLSQSKCYQMSKGALSCLTCHDPHGPASHDTAAYEKACLSCHNTPGKSTCKTTPLPADGCVRCHMPRRNSGQGILFSDHWIK